MEPVIAGRGKRQMAPSEGQMSVRYFPEKRPLFWGGVPLIRRFHKTVEPNRTIRHLGRMPLIRCSLGQGVPKWTPSFEDTIDTCVEPKLLPGAKGKIALGVRPIWD